MIKCIAFTLAAAATLICGGLAVQAAEFSPAYRCTTIITGEREETLIPGIWSCFSEVLVKATGNPDILVQPKSADAIAKAKSVTWSYTYHDRLFGKPIHDEQGTRDRPFDLTVQFDKTRTDQIIVALGARPWPEPRPTLAIFLGVNNTSKTYVLAEGQVLGDIQRSSFADASVKYGLPIVFPDSATLSLNSLAYETIWKLPPEQLMSMAKEAGASSMLHGTLDWSAKDLGWIGTWQMHNDGKAIRWQVRGVNFDAAFRNALEGAAQILSGSGVPRG